MALPPPSARIDFMRGEPSAAACSVCGGAGGNRVFGTADFQFGAGGEGGEIFRYLECAGCGCLQLLDRPADLAPYYPAGYYSHSAVYSPDKKGWLDKERLRARNLTGRPNLPSALLGLVDRLRGRRDTLIPLRCAVRAGAGFDDAILDVGCGSGVNILDFAAYGYKRLTGVDPFIARDIDYPNGVRIYKKSVFDLAGASFDFIALHHSFEHMDSPLSVLKKLRELLKPGKCLLLRMPVADGPGWPRYRGYWFPLDAPRHLLLHTRRSVEILAEQAGLTLTAVDIEKKSSYLLESERRLRRLPALDRKTRREIQDFAAAQAAKGIAEDAAFYLRR